MAKPGPARWVLQDPRWVQALFNTTELAWVWLIARVYVGWNWADAGWHKLQDDRWMAGGAALQGFWERAVAAPPGGRPVISYDWYRTFLSFMLEHGQYAWFAKLVAVGEFLVGLALLLGIFVGIAALMGAFMNWNFMLAGSASTNPVMGLLGLGVLVAWKTAGWWGLDRFVLANFGTPWQPGRLFGRGPVVPPSLGWKARQHPAEQWVRLLLGVGLALYALAALQGWLQVLLLLLAALWVAISGLGLAPLLPLRPQAPGPSKTSS
ncbi:MAG: DoxX family protein [Chloroflexi bacterium]|nr:DoxX family protein [Chloroflexota bacterium]